MKGNADEKSLLCIHFILLCYILEWERERAVVVE